MVAAMRHDGDGGSTYVARMVTICGGVDIMDETIVDDLGGWLPGWHVVEDENDFRWRRM